MKFFTTHITRLNSLSLIIITSAFLISCSSSQQVYDEDGIYNGTDARPSISSVEDSQTKSPNSHIYKSYFEKSAQELNDAQQRDSIFTDIDSYSSEEGSEIYVDANDFDSTIGYSGWGDQVDDVEVNIYNNSPFIGGFGYGGFGFNGIYGFNPYWNNWGYGGFGFNPYWNNWGYAGFGFNPYWNNWGYGGFYGNGFFANGYYGNRFYNHGFRGNFRYNNGRVAYNTGRRSSYDLRNANRRSSNVLNGRNANSGRRTATRSRTTYSRDRAAVRRSNSRNGVYRDGVNRGRPTTTRQRPNTRPMSRGGSKARTSGTTRPMTTRPSSRSGSSYGRSSSSSSRGSSMRSGSSSRSSGGTRSSSRSSSRGGGRRG